MDTNNSDQTVDPRTAQAVHDSRMKTTTAGPCLTEDEEAQLAQEWQVKQRGQPSVVPAPWFK